jgi:hypothetical protein
MNKSLLNGLVPAGDPCPFLDKCKFKVHQCPSDSNIKTTDYYCRVVTIHAKLAELDEKSADKMRNLVEKRTDK